MQAQKGQETCTKSYIERDGAATGLQARMAHCPLGLSVSLQSRREMLRQPLHPAESWSTCPSLSVGGLSILVPLWVSTVALGAGRGRTSTLPTSGSRVTEK